MSIDQEIRAASRQGFLGPEHLKLLARVGSPHQCCFCGHDVLALQTQCSHVTEHQVGMAVYFEGAYAGQYMGNNEVSIAQVSDGQGWSIPGVRSVIELPDAWKPRCTCDHQVAVPEQTMQEYQAHHGVDLRVLLALNPQRLHHISERNRDGTPQRWAVNGKITTWKTRPGQFRLPIKHGMYDYSYLSHNDATYFRTQPEWAGGSK